MELLLGKKEKHFLGINTSLVPFPKKDSRLDEIYPDAYKSLLDYDGVIISTKIDIHDKVSWTTTLEESILYHDYAEKLLEIYEKIKEQIVELLKNGKNVYVLMDADSNLYYNKSRGCQEFDLYSFLPEKIEVEYLHGNKIQFKENNEYFDFFNKTKEFYEYKAVIIPRFSTILANTSGTEKCVSMVSQERKGKIIFLPALKYCANYDIFLNAVFDLDNKMTERNNELVLPDWTQDFSILDEKEQGELIRNNISSLEKLMNKIDEEKLKLGNLVRYKGLLCASGEQLEILVKSLLSEIGFELLEAEKNRDDIIARYNGRFIVSEIKGVSKSAAEKHSAQLEKWASAFYEKNGVEPKAILIVNGYCDIPVFERPKDVFPKQMVDFSILKGQCLISTLQLLCLYIDIRKNFKNKHKMIEDFLNTIGVYDRYTDIKSFFDSRLKKGLC